MQPSYQPPDLYSEICEGISHDLETCGWSITEGFCTPELIRELAREARQGWNRGTFRHAGVGYGDELQVRPEIRNDRVRWLDPADCTPAQQDYLQQLETLRLAINSRLFLGLFDFEGHLAVYPPGSFYRRHLDQFRGVGWRTVTAVLYLNENWSDEDGGQLRIYTDPDNPDSHVDILPAGGTLVSFLSADFEHEVLPARRDRLSLTGWFRVRPTA